MENIIRLLFWSGISSGRAAARSLGSYKSSMPKETEVVFCQQCRSRNDAEDKYCRKCRARLMVVNWAEEAEDASLFDSSYLDEHILERVSALEESMRILSERMAIMQQTLTREHQHQEDPEACEGQGVTGDRAADK